MVPTPPQLPKDYNFKPLTFSVAKPVTSHVPIPRRSAQIAADQHYVYLFGGQNSCKRQRNAFKELWRFTKLTSTWAKLKTKGDAPMSVSAHSLVLLGKEAVPWSPRELLVFGGQENNDLPELSTSLSNEMHICNLTTLTWCKIQYDPACVPPQSSDQALVYDEPNNRLFLCGGQTAQPRQFFDIYQFNLSTNTWTFLSSGFYPNRQQHAMACYKYKLYIFGGKTFDEEEGTTVHSLNEILTFDLSTSQWAIENAKPDETKQFPAARYGHSSVRLDHRFYIFGGATESSIFCDYWSIDLTTLQWTCLSINSTDRQLPKPIYNASATSSATGELALFGGDTNTTIPTYSNELYTLHLHVPTFQTLTINAMILGLSEKINSSSLRTRRGNIKNLTISLIRKHLEEQNVASIEGIFDVLPREE